MLQQILTDMSIDPDLLSELDEEQKQILFCKIREEQVRRYRDREQALEAEEKAKQRAKGKQAAVPRQPKIRFLPGADGEPWTWVMGDHPTDKSIEQILEEEARANALRQAEAEAEGLRKQQTEELQLLEQLQVGSNTQPTANKTEKVDPPINSRRAGVAAATQPKTTATTTAAAAATTTATTAASNSQSSDSPVMRRTKASAINDLEAVKRRRSTEIYHIIKLEQQRSYEQAEHDGEEMNEAWREQERRAKEAEQEKRLIAKRAREDHYRAMRRLKTESQVIGAFTTSLQNIRDRNAKPVPGLKVCPDGRAQRPANKDEVMKWYKEVEYPRGAGLDPVTGQTASYFYGLIMRQDAEERLLARQPGTYLVRVSDRVWGYALSVRAENRCKHYLIDASDGRYRFFGTNQLVHNSLDHLVEYYKHAPASIVDNQLLITPCGTDCHSVEFSTLQPTTTASPLLESSYL